MTTHEETQDSHLSRNEVRRGEEQLEKISGN